MSTPEELLEEARAALHARTKKQEEEEQKAETSKTISLPSFTTKPDVKITLATISNVVLDAPGLTADDLPTAESMGHSSITPFWGFHCGNEEELRDWEELTIFHAWMCGETNIDDECDCGEWWTAEEPVEVKVGQCGSCNYIYHSDNIPKKIVVWACNSCGTWWDNCCSAADCCPDEDND